MPGLSGSVGQGGRNMPADVGTVQTLLNTHVNRLPGIQPLRVDRASGPKTIGAIRSYQQNVLRFGRPDGRVDVGGKTWQSLASPAVPSADAGAAAGAGVGAGPLGPAGGAAAGAAGLTPAGYTHFSHPDAKKVTLVYGDRAVKMLPTAEFLLKSILASCSMTGARITSTLRTYHDQA